MSVFFALSGFLICRFLWENQDIPTFFVRRIARIAPLVLLVSFLYSVVLFGQWDHFVILNLYLQNYLVEALTPATSPLWSLAVEMHFYIAIGLSILIFGRRGFWLLPIGAAIVLALRVEATVYSSINTHFRVDEILTGGMLAIAWLNRDSNPIAGAVMRALPKLFWPILILWALSCWPGSGPLAFARGYTAALLIGSVLGLEGRWQNKLLHLGVMQYIAAISFALYVWHSPFRAYWFNEGSDVVRYFVKRPISFACIFALAHLSTFYYEKPILKMARQWWPGRKHDS